MAHKIEGNTVIIQFDPKSETLSKSGKTIILASSGGFKWETDEKGNQIGIAYNIIKKKG